MDRGERHRAFAKAKKQIRGQFFEKIENIEPQQLFYTSFVEIFVRTFFCAPSDFEISKT